MGRVVVGGLVVLALILAGAAWYAGLLPPPKVSCSMADWDHCPVLQYPAEWVGSVGRPMKIDYREAPEEWATSADPGFQHAQWAARVERFLDEPIIAACYYSSEPQITCHAGETVFHAEETLAD